MRGLAAVFVVLSCLLPSGAEGQVGPAATTTTTPGTAGTTQGAGVGQASAAIQGGTTTTTLSAPAMSSETDDALPPPPTSAAVQPVDRSSPPPDQGTPAPPAPVIGSADAGPAIAPVESPVEGTTTTAVASPASVVIPDADQVALPEEPGGAVRLPALGFDTRLLARWSLLLALVLLVAPSVVEVLRGERR